MILASRHDVIAVVPQAPMDHVFLPTGQSPVGPLLSLFATRINA